MENNKVEEIYSAGWDDAVSCIEDGTEEYSEALASFLKTFNEFYSNTEVVKSSEESTTQVPDYILRSAFCAGWDGASRYFDEQDDEEESYEKSVQKYLKNTIYNKNNNGGE